MAHDHHHHGAGCSHSHVPPGVSSSKMALAVMLTVAFVIAEVICGFFSHSLALLSDAGHNFADAAALGFSWYALSIAKKPANRAMTYGYHRVGILAAMANAVSLVVIAILIFWEAISRLRSPGEVHGAMMIGVASAAIAMNLLIGFWLHAGAAHDLNVRSAYLHMMGDAISALGVVIAGIIVTMTGASLADPIVSFIIALLILVSSWGILKESVSVLLEATPAGLDMLAVESAIRGVEGVRDAHDLHVWTVGPGAIACSVHILVPEQTIRQGQQILQAVCAELQKRFDINHTTVQVEVEGHETNEMYCDMHSAPAAHRH